MKNPMRTGTMIAMTAASLFAAACSKKEEGTKAAPAAVEKTAKLNCEGANACKGQGGCRSEKNACKGQNGCKGQSFVETATAQECTTQGGTVAAAKM